ncbi:MAG: cupin domain-containing protein [Pseudomonadota bacterium]
MADFSLDTLLGGITPERFLAEYWQKKPLLVRQALPGFGGWLGREGLSELACRDDAESRLVRTRRGQWLLDHGPFEREELDALPKKGWSLLVSGVNHLLPQGDRLLHSFDFIPQARLDDLMVSFAPDGGGVGPHFDSYDVFLIQGLGRRRWEISGQDDLQVVDGAPLRILQRFRVDQHWELESGDMLYLPPRFAHNGVAIGECMTWSVGFRAPKAQEIVTQFLTYLQDTLNLDGMYADPDLARPVHSGEIPADLVDWSRRQIDGLRWKRDHVVDFLGRYLSEPKAHVFFDPPRRPLALAAFSAGARRRGLRLDARSQLLFRGRQFFMNGETLEVSPALAGKLRRLADTRELPGDLLDESLLDLCHAWYLAGYLAVG